MAQVSYGTITITDTTDLTTYIRYAKQAPLTAASQFQETPTTETHYIAVLSIPSSDTVPAWNSADWKWSEFIGTDGVSVLGTREIYYLKTNSTTVTAPTNGSDISQTSANVENQWTKNVPTYVTNGEYWTCIQTHLDGSPTWVYGSPVLNQSLTDMNHDIDVIKSITQQSAEDSQGAMSQAAATQIAQQALAHGLRKIWINEETSGTYLAGTYAASGLNNNPDNFDITNPSTYGFNSLLRHTYLSFRYNTHQLVTIGTGADSSISGIAIKTPIINSSNQIINTAKGMELTNGALKFYHAPTISGSTVTDGTLAMELTGNALNFYEPDGTTAATLDSTGLNIKTGTITLGSNFSVTSTGSITAKAGTIGGWTLGTNSIYSGTNSKTSTTAGTYLGTDAIRNYSSSTQYVHIEGGKITAKNVDLSGTITATAGTIGGFKIDSTSIRTNDVAITSNADNSIGLSSADFTRTINGTSRAGLRFAIGDKFGVTGDGVIYAGSAIISGTLSAGANSTIGPWTVTSTSIYKGNATYGTSGDGNMYFGNSGLSVSNKFKVDSAGNLTATSANITGTITATSGSFTGTIHATSGEFNGQITAGSGTIGRWQITSTALKTNSGSNSAGMGAESTYAFWAGNETPASAPFRVNYNGTLTATGAAINGAITATSFSAYSGSTKRAEMTTQGLKIYDSDGTQLCQFGSDNGAATIQLGKISGGHMYMSGTGGIQIYNSNTSSNYISVISSGVTIVGKVENNTVKSKSVIDSNGLSVYKDDMTNSIANFGSTIRIGKSNAYHLTIDSSSLTIGPSNANQSFTMSYSSSGYASLGTGNTSSTNYTYIYMKENEIKLATTTDTGMSEYASLSLTQTGAKITDGSLTVTGDLFAKGALNTSQYSANVHLQDSGKIHKAASSSKRYKREISKIQDKTIDPHKLYNLTVSQFKYKKGYISTEENEKPYAYPLIPGFIAEDVYDIYPVAVEFMNNQIETWDVKIIVPPMLALIQEQKQMIDELTKRVNILEKGEK